MEREIPSLPQEEAFKQVEDFVSRYWQEGPYSSLANVPDTLKVSDGDDSEVFLMPETNQVMKFYTRKLWIDPQTHKHLQFYRDITNKVSAIAVRDDWDITFEKSGFAKIRVNKIDELINVPRTSCMVGISPYIKGPNFADEINLIWQTKGVAPYEIRDWLPTINSRIEKAVGVKGIDVFYMNIKILKDDNDLTITITDLCTKISDLRNITK